MRWLYMIRCHSLIKFTAKKWEVLLSRPLAINAPDHFRYSIPSNSIRVDMHTTRTAIPTQLKTIKRSKIEKMCSRDVLSALCCEQAETSSEARNCLILTSVRKVCWCAVWRGLQRSFLPWWVSFRILSQPSLPKKLQLLLYPRKPNSWTKKRLRTKFMNIWPSRRRWKKRNAISTSSLQTIKSIWKIIDRIRLSC